ncbi:hypothetical protein [Streptosporangium subroseum]|nr:hypothetical protein [Streptosporangium subroseum]
MSVFACQRPPGKARCTIFFQYARCSTLGQELDALAKHDIPRDKVFSG